MSTKTSRTVARKKPAGRPTPLPDEGLNDANSAWIPNPVQGPGQPAMIQVRKDAVALNGAMAPSAGIPSATANGVGAPPLVQRLSLKEQAEQLGLMPSYDDTQRGPLFYSSFILFGPHVVFILELEADEVAALQAEMVAIDEDLSLFDDAAGELTDAQVEAFTARMNAVPGRKIAWYEKVIGMAARGSVTLHPFNAARQARLYPSQKADLAQAILLKSQQGREGLSFLSAS